MVGAWGRRLAGVGVVALAAVGLAACEPAGFAIEVNSTADGGDANPGDGVCEMTPGVGNCSLRAAIDESNAPQNPNHETITFAEGITAITLTGSGDDTNATGDLDILDGVTIDGGWAGVTITGSGADRVFDVHGGDPAPFVNLERITITGGLSDQGGGIRLLGPQHTMVEASLLYQNGAVGAGGAAYVGPGASLYTKNATIGENGATGPGGAIYSAGSVMLQYTTVQGTWAIADTLHRDAAATGAFQLAASIIGVALGNPGCGGAVTSLGGNVGVSGTCGLNQSHDTVVADPQLAALGDVGGPTLAYGPLVGSPALDRLPPGLAGCGSLVEVDGIGVPRPQGLGCESGAVELPEIIHG